MPKKMRVSFSGTDREIKLKKQRADINLKILRSKSKSEEKKLQKELRAINKKLRTK